MAVSMSVAAPSRLAAPRLASRSGAKLPAVCKPVRAAKAARAGARAELKTEAVRLAAATVARRPGSAAWP